MLDGQQAQIGKTVRARISGPLKDALSGTWMGHALHPILTDLVIGSWTSATMLDLLGGEDNDDAAQKLIAIGLASYGPTALTGWTDWADSESVDEEVRRVGLVHATVNGIAFALYAGSLASRRRGRRGLGVALALAGAGTMTSAAISAATSRCGSGWASTRPCSTAAPRTGRRRCRPTSSTGRRPCPCRSATRRC